MNSDSHNKKASVPPYLSYKYVMGGTALLLLFTFVGLFTYVMTLVAVFCLTFLLRHQLHKTAMVMLICTPLTFCFIWGVRDYLNGTGELLYSGLPNIKRSSMDPHWRCMQSNEWTFALGLERVFQFSYNLGIQSMTRYSGWMPGTYKGPYPTQDEANEALESGFVVSLGSLQQDEIEIQGDNIFLDDKVGAELFDNLYPFNPFDSSAPQVTAAIWKQECLILRIPLLVFAQESSELGAAIVLISIETGRPFAYYGENGYNHRFPPVEWKRERAEKFY